jgi:hypothetical protein
VQFLIYDWNGKCKWAYIMDTYLIDPNFLDEFIKTNCAFLPYMLQGTL